MFLLFCIFLNLKYNKERGDKMETYNMLIDLLKKYFKNRNIKDIFCYGGCFYFASKIKENKTIIKRIIVIVYYIKIFNRHRVQSLF